MIDYLIYDQTKKKRLKMSDILKVINFLIFWDFLSIFMNFSKLILNLF